MWLFVGLGNPGKEYEKTRHNIGFMFIDALRDHYPSTNPSRRFQGECAETIVAGTKVLTLKPTTFMNLSGLAVAAIAQFYKIPITSVVIFHDELDLPLGKIRVKTGGGHGGHNGIKSIDAHVGNATTRVRMGIGHPGQKDAVTSHVLGPFSSSERDQAHIMVDGVTASCGMLLTEGMEAFLRRYQTYYQEHQT